MNEIVKLGISAFFGFILGTIVGSAGRDLLNLSWKGEVGVDSIISLLSAAVVGLFLQQAFQKRVESSRIEQNMLIESLKDAIKHLREIRNDFRTCYNGQLASSGFSDRFLQNLRMISNSFTSTRDLIEVLGHVSYVAKCDELLLNTSSYKGIITGDKTTDLFTSWHHQKQEELYKKINILTYELMIDLNRL